MEKRSQEEMIIATRLIFNEKGVVQLSDYVNEKTPIRFKCTRCGKEHSILWSQIVQGINPEFICIDCSYANRSKSESHTYADLELIFEERGSRLIVPEGTNMMEKVKTHDNVRLVCTYCGEEFDMQYYSFKRGRNQNLRCPKCARIKTGNYIRKEHVPHEVTRQKNYQMIKDTMESIGAVLLTPFEEYKDKNTYLRFKCSKCGKEHTIRWNKFEAGQNKNLLCTDCLPPKRSLNTAFVRKEFEKHGVTLLNEYVNNKEPLMFNCKQCGKVYSINWGNYTNGRNPYFLCDECRAMNMAADPQSSSGTTSENGLKRPLAEARCREYIKSFYNIKKEDRCNFEAHHVKPFGQFPDLIFSFCNLYPLPKEEHHTNNFKYYHQLKESQNPENWSDSARLPYHNYEGFHFFDLNKYMVTDLILDEIGEMHLYNRKKDYADAGLFYIPFYMSELLVYRKSFIVYSMIRYRLSRFVGNDIYKYTGQKFTRYNTRKLEVRPVIGMDAYNFFEDNHIQGYVDASNCLGLYQGDTLVAAMSFGAPRPKKWQGTGNFEMYRFCTKLNSSVPGAASKLFKYFVDNYNPELILTFCDCRFSSIDPNETVYPKLGFVYDGYSEPNYKYYKDGNLYSRRLFMKSRLQDKLEIFDSNLSETENMRMNGYTKLYDCGNFRYVWRKTHNS